MRNKEFAAIRYREAHLQQAHAAKASGTPFVPEQDYCPVCTSIDRKCPNEFPGCQDLEDTKSECCDWVEDSEEHASEARAPLRKTKTLTKILTYQTPKPPA